MGVQGLARADNRDRRHPFRSSDVMTLLDNPPDGSVHALQRPSFVGPSIKFVLSVLLFIGVVLFFGSLG